MNTNHSHITASEYTRNCQSLALAGQYIMISHSLALAGQCMLSCKLEGICKSPQQAEANILHHKDCLLAVANVSDNILHHRDYLLGVGNVSDMKYPFPS